MHGHAVTSPAPSGALQVDKAYDMIERLLRVDDDELNEHKRLQLRELAALNGTLKDEQPCYHCGELGHRPMECPKQKQEIYVLPEHMQSQVGWLAGWLAGWRRLWPDQCADPCMSCWCRVAEAAVCADAGLGPCPARHHQHAAAMRAVELGIQAIRMPSLLSMPSSGDMQLNYVSIVHICMPCAGQRAVRA